MDLLCRKGHYPYEWVDNINKLDHKDLPSNDKFYSKLKHSGISREDYKHALKTYMKNWVVKHSKTIMKLI